MVCSPRNCIPPEVLLRVSMHSACSTSENALEKPLDIRKLDNSSYQALGACFKPYKAFLKSRLFMDMEGLVCSIGNESPNLAFQKRATGANDSSKSVPSS
ncbi:hypothetical protein Tco_1175068 [Tanacetum coccineum]